MSTDHPRPNVPEEEIPAELLFDDDLLPPDHRSGFVAVVGRPNVGKSTLMNAYLGQKIAIVSSRPQTTRNQLLGILTLKEAQLVFVDTPGIHHPQHKLGQYMVDTATRAIPDADLVLWLVDGAERPHRDDRLVAEAVARVKDRLPVILALNKIDKLQPDQVQDRLNAYLKLLKPDASLPISAIEGDNCDALLQTIIAHLPPGPRFFPAEQVTDVHIRFIAGEMVREAALQVLRDELPHAVAIEVEEFKERSQTMTYISAIIYVERDTQKAIVIGKGGQTLKRIGQVARKAIEALVQTQVYLELRVKVRPNWRQQEKLMRRLGYG